jgi:hypothetical protein
VTGDYDDDDVGDDDNDDDSKYLFLSIRKHKNIL